MKQTVKAAIAASIGYGMFGLGIMFIKVTTGITTPMVVMAYRFLVAIIVMSLMIPFLKQKPSFKGKPVKRLILMGLIQPSINFVFQAYGISMCSSSFSGIIMGTAPIMGLVFGVLLLKESWTPLQVFFTVFSVVGVIFTASGGMAFTPLGFVLILGGMITSALFATVSRSISKEFTAFERTYAMTVLGLVTFVCLALVETKANFALIVAPLAVPSFWLGILYQGICASVLSFMFINYALTYLPAGRSIMFCNFATVVSVLAGIFIMKESFTWLQLLGVVIIIASVLGVTAKKKTPALK